MCVHTLSRKWRSWETTITVFLKLEQELLEPQDRVHVQVVGGLVEQQDVGLAEQRLREQHAHLLAVVELLHQAPVLVLADAERAQQRGRVGLGVPAVELAELALELGRARAVFVAEVRLGVERVLLGHHLVQLRVAHDHGGERVDLVVGEVVLAQHAQAHVLGDHDPAREGSWSPERQLQEGGLARAVGADQAVAVAGRELDVDVLEQRAAAEVEREAFGGNHGFRLRACLRYWLPRAEANRTCRVACFGTQELREARKTIHFRP